VSPTERRYKAFISYSHAADGKLAPALQTGLERFAKPWYRLRALRIFRDKTGLAVTPKLWGSIQKALESTEYFILLASPTAAESKWVRREIEFWLENHSTDHLLIVLTNGEIAWDSQQGDFDWSKTDALPRLLEKKFKGEPNYLDLRWARADTDLSIRRPRFLDAIAAIAATLRNVPLDDLIGEDVAHYRTTRKLLSFTVVALLLLTLSALYAAYLSNQARSRVASLESERNAEIAAEKEAKAEESRKAEAQRLAELEVEKRIQTSRRLASASGVVLSKDRQLATLLAIEAARSSPTPEAESALRQTLIKRSPPVILQGPTELTVESVSFSSDGRRLLAVFEDGSVRIWTISSPGRSVELKRESILDPQAERARAMFSPDGSTVLTVPVQILGTLRSSGREQAAARLWNSDTGQLRRELKHEYIQDGMFSPDGKKVVTVGEGDPVRIWSAATGAVLATLKDHEHTMMGVDFSRDGKLFLTADTWGTVRIRDASDGKTISELHDPGEKIIVDAVFSPDSRWVLTANIEGPLRLWDWRNAPGTGIPTEKSPSGISSNDFSADGNRLITLGDGSVRVWDTLAGRALFELAYDDDIGSATFNPDGRWIATTTDGNTNVIWDASNGKRLIDLGKYQDSLTIVTFSDDSSRIASGTTQGQILLYPCGFCGSLEMLLTVAQTQVTRSLTAEERTHYLAEGQ
jgi:WD40 repeat protein